MREFSGLRGAFVVLVVTTSCTQAAFNAAAKRDVSDAWRQFIAQHPTDEHLDEARARLAALEFAHAKQAHTIVGYKRYLDEFSAGDDAPAARALLEALRFNAAVDAPSVAAWSAFLRAHPDGAHHEEAEANLARLELLAVADEVSPVALKRLATENPDDPRSAQARARLDELDWAKATTARALFEYLRVHEAGAHRDEAKAQLLGLKLDGLLASLQIETAVALAKRDPLGLKLSGLLAARVEAAKAIRALATSKDERVRRSLASYAVRSLDDLVAAAKRGETFDRWQAVEELAWHSDVRAIDPLLDAFRSARSLTVRVAAFESLRLVLSTLPPGVAEYELWARIEAARLAGAPQAILFDLATDERESTALYQRSFEANAPDPFVLWRWATVRRAQNRHFSAAVAARQLAVWALEETASCAAPESANARRVARELCDASRAATVAAEIIAEARTALPNEPDLVAFATRAATAADVSGAKLRDAELLLPSDAPRCANDPVHERLEQSTVERLALVRELKKTQTDSALFQFLAARDPSKDIRAAAGK